MLVLAALALVGGCSDDDPSGATTSSTASPALINGGGPVLDDATIDGHVEAAAGDDTAPLCTLVLHWTYELVGAVNGFTTTSRTLTETDRDERRHAYLDTFDAALRLTAELDAALGDVGADDATEAASALVSAATGRARAELEGARAAAAEPPDTAYALRRVEGGRNGARRRGRAPSARSSLVVGTCCAWRSTSAWCGSGRSSRHPSSCCSQWGSSAAGHSCQVTHFCWSVRPMVLARG